MDNQTCVALILARGGSKGIPRKNLQKIAGESLLARCVRTCLAAQRVTYVSVSTDDDEIASEALASGASIIRRPDYLAVDSATSVDAILHACDYCRADFLASVECTAPLITPDEIDGAIEVAAETRADCVVLGTRTDEWQCDEFAGLLRPIGWSIEQGTRRQDRKPTYCLEGLVVVRYVDFVRRWTVWGTRNVLFKVERRHLDIDTPEDLEIARAIVERRIRLTRQAIIV